MANDEISIRPHLFNFQFSPDSCRSVVWTELGKDVDQRVVEYVGKLKAAREALHQVWV